MLNPHIQTHWSGYLSDTANIHEGNILLLLCNVLFAAADASLNTMFHSRLGDPRKNRNFEKTAILRTVLAGCYLGKLPHWLFGKAEG